MKKENFIEISVPMKIGYVNLILVRGKANINILVFNDSECMFVMFNRKIDRSIAFKKKKTNKLNFWLLSFITYIDLCRKF